MPMSKKISRRCFLQAAGTSSLSIGLSGLSACSRSHSSKRNGVTYPPPLRPGDVIGIAAPSAGMSDGDQPRLDFCLQKLATLGYQARLGACLWSEQIVSAPAPDRARELEAMLLDETIAAVMPPWGGELLIDILPLIDWQRLCSAPPKWIIGYSDISTFMFAYTLLTHHATMNGTGFMEIPIEPTDPNLAYWNSVLTLEPGAVFTQHSATLYQPHDVDWQKNPYATAFDRTAPVEWKCLGRENDRSSALQVTGRLIGGTLDVIGMLVSTPFGDLDSFVAHCAPEGLLFYLDNCDFNTAQYCRLLHHLRLSGWFNHVNALLIGRTASEAIAGFSQRDVLVDALSGLEVPVLYDLDIGHRPPQLILVNGARATLEFSPSVKKVTQELVA